MSGDQLSIYCLGIVVIAIASVVIFFLTMIILSVSGYFFRGSWADRWHATFSRWLEELVL